MHQPEGTELSRAGELSPRLSKRAKAGGDAEQSRLYPVGGYQKTPVRVAEADSPGARIILLC